MTKIERIRAKCGFTCKLKASWSRFVPINFYHSLYLFIFSAHQSVLRRFCHVKKKPFGQRDDRFIVMWFHMWIWIINIKTNRLKIQTEGKKESNVQSCLLLEFYCTEMINQKSTQFTNYKFLYSIFVHFIFTCIFCVLCLCFVWVYTYVSFCMNIIVCVFVWVYLWECPMSIQLTCWRCVYLNSSYNRSFFFFCKTKNIIKIGGFFFSMQLTKH